AGAPGCTCLARTPPRRGAVGAAVRACAPALRRAGAESERGDAGRRERGPLPPRAPMYAFYSLLIYIFYSLFRRDGAAAAAADPEAAQSARRRPGGRRRPDQPDQPEAELWSELTGLVGCSESGHGPGRGGPEDCPAEVSLEEALVRLAEFLSAQLESEGSCGKTPNLSQPGDVPPLLTVTGQLLALLAWTRGPRGRQALPQGTQPASGLPLPSDAGGEWTLEGAVPHRGLPASVARPRPVLTPGSSRPGPSSQGESHPLPSRAEAGGQQPLGLEEDQRAWPQLEQLILGQLEELKQQLGLQEEELDRLRLGVGATDSEKRLQHLTLENEALKQSLSLTRDLLLHWGPSPAPRDPQGAAEALGQLQGQLREAQDTTEALREQLGVQEVQLQGLQGALRQLQQEKEQNCRRELRQVHGQLAGLRARMASLRQGCGDLRGLVSTFTQSCQGSLSEARGQVSWALGALSAGGPGPRALEEQRFGTRCPGRLLELKGMGTCSGVGGCGGEGGRASGPPLPPGNIRVLCRLRPGPSSSLVSSEPGPGGTVTTCYRGRQRRFRLDWVFPPDASQEEVIAAAPLPLPTGTLSHLLLPPAPRGSWASQDPRQGPTCRRLCSQRACIPGSHRGAGPKDGSAQRRAGPSPPRACMGPSPGPIQAQPRPPLVAKAGSKSRPAPTPQPSRPQALGGDSAAEAAVAVQCPWLGVPFCGPTGSHPSWLMGVARPSRSPAASGPVAVPPCPVTTPAFLDLASAVGKLTMVCQEAVAGTRLRGVCCLSGPQGHAAVLSCGGSLVLAQLEELPPQQVQCPCQAQAAPHLQVFSELEPAVLSCLRGYSVCVFTYGQTGAGKTYSMEVRRGRRGGAPGRAQGSTSPCPQGPPQDPGIAPRALQSLFREMGTVGQHRVSLSMLEIYNEAVRDLLAPGPPERLAVRQGPAGQGGVQVAGLTTWDVPNLETLHQMLSLGRSNRATAATAMNPRSSRSHALVTLTLRGAAPPRGPGTAGTLHLVDLAGSERAWKAGAAAVSPGDRDGAQRLREARTINRSLLALGGVMAALRARRPHVPFRDSQLTRLLQPALGPGATAVLLLQISTRPEDLGETVCSLKFAERVGQVELGPARRRRAPRSGTPSSFSTDTPLTGTPCAPTPAPGSPPSPAPGSGSSATLPPAEDPSP
ncbi:Kinesin-like protein KIFC2, partial [Galemys pyrenaicus]